MKLLASDFDGTLAFNNEIKESDIKKIKEFQEAGNLFGMSTGRNLEGILHVTDPYGIHLDFLVLASGSKLVGKNGQVLFDRPLNKDIVTRIYNATRCPKEYMFFTEKGAVVIHRAVSNRAFRLIEDISELEDVDYAFMAIKFMDGEEDQAQEAVDFINAHFSDEIIAYRNTINVDVVTKGCSKGKGVLMIAEHFNLDKEDIAVIGDSMNDISMFDVTDHAYSFEHIEPALKKHVNHFVGSVGECIDDLLRKEKEENHGDC